MTRAELAALVGAMTEGTWEARRQADGFWKVKGSHCVVSDALPDDAHGIVALRNHAEKLLAVCEAAEAVVGHAGSIDWADVERLRAKLRDLEGA